MPLATLEQAKQHLRYDDSEQDDLISHLLDATAAYLARIGVAMTEPVPAAVIAAQLLLVARLFAHRGEPLEGAVRDDPMFRTLIHPYREVPL